MNPEGGRGACNGKGGMYAPGGLEVCMYLGSLCVRGPRSLMCRREMDGVCVSLQRPSCADT